jgi:dihydroorotase
MKYDLVLHGATVIDPSQEIHGRFDVAVAGDRIVAVAQRIEAGEAGRLIDLSGKVLTPGWVDIHAHVYAGVTTWGIKADAFCLATGVTTIVDAGSPGWANFLGFEEYIVAPSRTQVLTFVHISGIGLTYGPLGEMEDLRYGDPARTAFVVQNWPDICVGVKVRQGKHQVGDNGVRPLRLALEAAEAARVPVMVHIGAGVPLPDVLAEMREGDIATHCYQGVGDGIIGEDGGVIPQVWEARQRGVVFDIGHGGGSFDFEVARAALANGFAADVISTDIHAHSIHHSVYSLPETASKLLNLGAALDDVVRQSTTSAAAAIGRGDELGTLRVGTVADLAAFEILDGEFEFHDVRRRRLVGARKIEPVLTVRAGQVYRPQELAEEVAETLRRAGQMKAITAGNFPEAIVHGAIAHGGIGGAGQAG